MCTDESNLCAQMSPHPFEDVFSIEHGDIPLLC